MKKLLLLILLTFFSSNSVGGVCGPILTFPKVITQIDSYRIIITEHLCSAQAYVGMYYYSGQVVDKKNNIIVGSVGISDGENDWLSIVDTPEGFPFLTIHSYLQGNSAMYHQYDLYSTSPVFKKIGVIQSPLNKYQVNNRNGSEHEVDGFYKDSNGNFLIDRLTDEGTFFKNLGEGPPSWSSNVETVKIVDGALVSMGLRPYLRRNYQRLYSLPEIWKFNKKNLSIVRFVYEFNTWKWWSRDNFKKFSERFKIGRYSFKFYTYFQQNFGKYFGREINLAGTRKGKEEV